MAMEDRGGKIVDGDRPCRGRAWLEGGGLCLWWTEWGTTSEAGVNDASAFFPSRVLATSQMTRGEDAKTRRRLPSRQ